MNGSPEKKNNDRGQGKRVSSNHFASSVALMCSAAVSVMISTHIKNISLHLYSQNGDKRLRIKI